MKMPSLTSYLYCYTFKAKKPYQVFKTGLDLGLFAGKLYYYFI